jgi:hypothetical protein
VVVLGYVGDFFMKPYEFEMGRVYETLLGVGWRCSYNRIGVKQLPN